MDKAVRAKRELCAQRMSEIHAIALRASSDEGERAIFLECYADVDRIAQDFEAMHLRIIQDGSYDFKTEDEIRAKFDKSRYQIKSIYRQYAPSTVVSSGATSTSKFKLPKISLPIFSGDLTCWPSFFALFNTSIHNNSQLTNTEKFQYLLSSLQGDALTAISNLPLSDDHYAIAYDTLVGRYKNKRKLASHYWNAIAGAKQLKMDSAESLRRLLDTFSENLRALELMEFPVDLKDFILLNVLLDKLTPSSREKFEVEHRKTEIPRFKQLVKFLSEYSRVFASLSIAPLPNKFSDKPFKSSSSKPVTTATFVTNEITCPQCQQSHLIVKCPAFLRLTEKDRHAKARQLRLCINCLKAGHRASSCPSHWRCRKCNESHHSLLHFASKSDSRTLKEPDASSSTKDVASANATTVASSEASVISMTSLSRSNSVVLLSTVKAEVADASGHFFPVRVLLDSASQSNFVTESCFQRSGFTRTPCRSIVQGLNDTKAATTRGRTSLVLRVKGRSDLRLPLEAIILTKISSPLPNIRADLQEWSHLKGVSLADPEYYQPGSIDILLGAENFVSILRDGHRRGKSGEPDAFNTIFGWVLMGAISTSRAEPVRSFVTTLGTLDASIRRFWSIEEVPSSVAWSVDDKRCESMFSETTRRDRSGRFVVSYPFAEEPPRFVDSRPIALNRFRALERRFRKDVAYQKQYQAFIREYLDCGHMELLSQPFPADGPVYYMPHHGVIKLESESTKLRVVFDASTQATNGLSLNHTMLSGPKLQQDIVAILLRFRLGAIAVTTDIKQMFRQILIEPGQRDYQRIVWRFSEDEPVADYRLTTVTFGIAPSPYLAIRCLMQLAEEGQHSHPLASRVLRSSLYVDDIVASLTCVKDARELTGQLRSLLQSAGFELRKWASSHSSVLADIPSEHCSRSMLSFGTLDDDSIKVLGLYWHARNDEFGFRVRPLNRDCTKRIILSEMARVFDPLGFLAPLTFAAKLLIQRLWTQGLDWDERPPKEICQQWERYKRELPEIDSVRVPRSLAYRDVARAELHGFCDASERGYGAVIYVRIVSQNASCIRLLAAKSKVAPLKSLSLPRLELCGALLLSNLLRFVRLTLEESYAVDACYAWSDSTIVLAWIRSSPHKLETFVRNRVARIQENTVDVSWGHVGTESNPADHCSRGLFPRELVNCRLWWKGPEWLKDFNPREDSSTYADELVAPVETETASTIALLSADPPHNFDWLLHRFSSLSKICRIMSYCLRFIHKARQRSVPATLAVDQSEEYVALLILVRAVQTECFARDLANIRKFAKVSKEIRKLTPFLDSQGLLRVGGRLSNAQLPYESRHPALLPNKHRLTDLLVEHTHRQNLHPGRRALQYMLCQRFWVLGLQRAIKRCLSRCYQCFRANPHVVQPPMASLPAERVNQVKPFSIAGVDFAGPFMVTPRRARGVHSIKIYVCVFVCFAVKALHLEVAFSLSTGAFLSALRRFIARRGRCSLIFSDCGRNFVGAQRELAKNMEQASEREKIRWSFNPPSAPHFGGLWEAGVKSFKTHLHRVVGEQVLTVEEFQTVLSQIEAVLNSRPLCPLSADPSDLEVLSPGHFLTTEPLVALPGPDFSTTPMRHLDRWQLLQRMLQDFWQRWRLEYLQTLQQRPKWLKQVTSLAEGALVLVHEANASPLQWKRGRVTQLHPGRDGVPRVATVRTAEGMLTRPLVKLCPLPMDSSPAKPS